MQNRIAEIKIIKFSKKGNGIGIIEESKTPVEVPFTMPGDHVKVELSRKRRGSYQGKLLEVIQPAADRVLPRCKHFAICGGCRWQQVSYEKQLLYKEELIRQLFAKWLSEDVPLKPVIPCGFPWQYRNKMEFSFSSDAKKNQYLGLIMDSSRGKVMDLSECHLTNPWFIDVLKATKQWWTHSGLEAYHFHHNQGALRTLTVREGMRTGDRLVMLTVSGNPDYALHKSQLDSFVATVRQAVEPANPNQKLSIFLRIQQIAKGQQTNFYEMHLYGPDHIREILDIYLGQAEKPFSLNFQIGPTAFFQPNTRQAQTIYSIALQMANIPQNAVVYDLYCGTGTLGICLSKRVKQVIGVEISLESVVDARTNITLNSCDNVTIFSGSVRDVLQKIKEDNQLPKPDVVMVDPPRPGLDPDAIRHLLNLNAPKILYISCNPVTQAENIAELIEKGGYRLESIQTVDQFPQTVNMENIVVLTKGLSL